MFSLVLLPCFAIYCQSLDQPYQLEQGVAYRLTERGPLTIDIAMPGGKGPFPCIVYVGWGGVAAYNTDAAIYATQRGYVGITVDYRRIVEFPMPIADLRCALGWVAANRTRFKVDSSRIALAGFEFGANTIALMVTYTTESNILTDQCENPSQGYRVRAVVSPGAPTDWRTTQDKHVLQFPGGQS